MFDPWHCCELWCRPAVAALIQPLAWELAHGKDAALKKKKKKKKKKAATACKDHFPNYSEVEAGRHLGVN